MDIIHHLVIIHLRKQGDQISKYQISSILCKIPLHLLQFLQLYQLLKLILLPHHEFLPQHLSPLWSGHLLLLLQKDRDCFYLFHLQTRLCQQIIAAKQTIVLVEETEAVVGGVQMGEEEEQEQEMLEASPQMQPHLISTVPVQTKKRDLGKRVEDEL